ncbi:TPA: hypothetical protein HA238_03730 [Candidatus Micrarchaeota archaeon]|nr:hypothetical protein [Candidatus Micrarchaeota archaeon]
MAVSKPYFPLQIIADFVSYTILAPIHTFESLIAKAVVMKKFKTTEFLFLFYDIEDFLRKERIIAKRKAWANFSDKINYNEFSEILSYLRESNKIKFVNKDRVKWAFQPLCDYDGICINKAYREVYPSLLGGKYRSKGWSYLCKKHFRHEQKRFKGKLPYVSTI